MFGLNHRWTNTGAQNNGFWAPEPRLRSAKNGDGKVANRLTVWRLSRQCHGVRKRVASVKVCPLGGPAIPWRWQLRLAHTDVQPTHPLSGHRRRVSGRSEAGEWVCPIPRAEEQRRPPTWGIRPLCCEKTRGRTQMCVSQVADRAASEEPKKRTKKRTQKLRSRL